MPPPSRHERQGFPISRLARPELFGRYRSTRARADLLPSRFGGPSRAPPGAHNDRVCRKEDEGATFDSNALRDQKMACPHRATVLGREHAVSPTVVVT